jgi:hypothetical protein
VTWHRLFAKHHQTISKKERRVFLDSFAKEVSPKAIEHFISETDRIILRHRVAEYHLLDMLRDNRQGSVATMESKAAGGAIIV